MTTGWIRHQRWRQLHGEYEPAVGMTEPTSEPRYDLILGGVGWLRETSSAFMPGTNRGTNHRGSKRPRRGVVAAPVSAAAGLLACLRTRLSYPHGCFYAVAHAGPDGMDTLSCLERAVVDDCAADTARGTGLSPLGPAAARRGGFALSITRAPMETLKVASSPSGEQVWLGSRDAAAAARRSSAAAGPRRSTRREAVANGMPYALVAVRWARPAR
jgi:hypothetical protein